GVSVPPQATLARYLLQEFGASNLGFGGLSPGGCGELLYGIADHNNSLERAINRGIKIFTRRARPTISVALYHLKEFVLHHTQAEARSQFAYDVDYFGGGTKFYSSRYFDVFNKGKQIVEEKDFRRPFIKHPTREEWFVPSGQAMKELERLVENNVIRNNGRAKIRRLQQWLSTFQDFRKVENASDISEDFNDFFWWSSAFYKLCPKEDIPFEFRAESWRWSFSVPQEQRAQFWKFHCDCPFGISYNFCKHGFALALVQGIVTMPSTRSDSLIGNPRKKGRPSTAAPCIR
ncbi:MAG: hypothetical protein AAGM67_16735, partial [Bacteroidota bacterium]